ncbi:MAG: putative photosynthetic complex assembly protein PuhE [Hyphomicrobium sp.]|nr:putative photosynthetic complex assembly protein PuhE [Hyphomicrobium sp.]
MTEYGWPVLYVLFVWWFSTGAVLYVIGLPRRMYPALLAAASALSGLAIYGLATSADDGSVTGAYLAFTAALVVWGWHEMSFLTGLVTGPRTTPLSTGAVGMTRFREASETLLYHEIAIVLTLVVIGAVTLGQSNETGFWTFFVLWAMRLSAKLNVYFGVPNLTEEFLPPHLTYLKTYFRRQPMNLLFPVSVTASTIAAVAVAMAAAGSPSEGQGAGLALVTALLVLAIIEHWFLVLPIPAAALWTWGLASRDLPSVEDLRSSVPEADRSPSLPPRAAVIGLDEKRSWSAS